MADVDVNLRVKSDDAAVKSTGLKFTELSSAIGLAKQAFAIIKGVADEVIGSFTAYAKTVEDMARVTGSGAEETSRLIQVADDLQISATDLSTALAGAVRKGIDPSVQSIAALSDEYLKLQPGLEQSKFLMDNFGRSGLEMARLMEQGSGAILEMGAAVDDNLIITEDAIKANQDYYASLDTLNDAFEGVKVSLGQKLVPVLTQAAEAMGLLVGWSDKLEAAFATQETSLENTATSYREYAIGSIAAADAAGQLDERQQRIAESLLDGTMPAEKAAEYTNELAAALELTDQKTWNAEQSTTDWMDALDGARSEADDTRQSYDDLGLTLDDVKSSFQETTKEMLFNSAAENLTADEALKLAIQMGLVNAETLGYQASMEELNTQLASGEITAGEYRDAVAALGEQIDAVAHPYDIMVNFTYDPAAFAEMYAEISQIQQAANGIGISAGGGQIPEARANGGPVVSGRPYIVGERGPEVVVPQQAGYVIPNRGSALTTYNIVINGNASATDIIRRARIAEAYGV